MGEDPRYLGSKDACTFSTANLGIAKNASDKICPKAAVTMTSGSSALISSSPSLDTFAYCNTGIPSSCALTLSGDGARLYPRPTGLSRPVTTAHTGYTELSFSSTVAEKSGVPINTIFIFLS